MEHGFIHLRDLTQLWKMTLVNNKYLTNDSVESLSSYPKNKLKWLHLANNGNISHSGLMNLTRLQQLEYLKLENLQELKKPQETLSDLQSKMPHCQIEFPPYINKGRG